MREIGLQFSNPLNGGIGIWPIQKSFGIQLIQISFGTFQVLGCVNLKVEVLSQNHFNFLSVFEIADAFNFFGRLQRGHLLLTEFNQSLFSKSIDPNMFEIGWKMIIIPVIWNGGARKIKCKMMVLTATKFEGKSDISIRNNRIGSLQASSKTNTKAKITPIINSLIKFCNLVQKKTFTKKRDSF